MPQNSSHDVVMTEASAVVLLDEICSKLECGSIFHLDKRRLSHNATCFDQCLYQDGLLRNCSLSDNNCTLILGVVCGKNLSQNKLTSLTFILIILCYDVTVM